MLYKIYVLILTIPNIEDSEGNGDLGRNRCIRENKQQKQKKENRE